MPPTTPRNAAESLPFQWVLQTVFGEQFSLLVEGMDQQASGDSAGERCDSQTLPSILTGLCLWALPSRICLSLYVPPILLPN